MRRGGRGGGGEHVEQREGGGAGGSCAVLRCGGGLWPSHPRWLTRRAPMWQIKPFLKCVNYNHVMPTRYALDVELKSIVTGDVVSGANPTTRQNARKDVKKIFEEKYAAAAVQTHDWRAARRRRQCRGRCAALLQHAWSRGRGACSGGSLRADRHADEQIVRRTAAAAATVAALPLTFGLLGFGRRPGLRAARCWCGEAGGTDHQQRRQRRASQPPDRQTARLPNVAPLP